MISAPKFDRRHVLGSIGFASLALFAPGAFATRLTETASMSEGPLYPDLPHLDTDNDLLIINDAITPAIGEVTRLSGRILDQSGTPVRNAFVEIWQCDANGLYRHSSHSGALPGQADENFQGYGRFLTDSSGAYQFRTIRPVPYTYRGAKRSPHIHFAVSKNGQRIFTSQVFVKGHRQNKTDFLLKELDPALRETLLVDFVRVPGRSYVEASARFDVVLGMTAHEGDDGRLRGGISGSTWDPSSFKQ